MERKTRLESPDGGRAAWTYNEKRQLRNTNTGPRGGGISVGISTSGSANYSEKMLLDINGDGLPDWVRKAGNRLMVLFNWGDRFADREEEAYLPEWGELAGLQGGGSDGSADASALGGVPVIGRKADQGAFDSGSVSGGLGKYADKLDYSSTVTFGMNGGVNGGVTVSIPIFSLRINISGSMNAGANGSASHTAVAVRMTDIDGDGLPDQVLRVPGLGTFAKLNLGGQAGLLKEVKLPYGGKYEVSYKREGNTASMPQARYVMAAVIRDDGEEEAEGECHRYEERFEYKDGRYDRRYKEFFGFSEVTTVRADGSAETVRYKNGSYYEKGFEELRTLYSRPGGSRLREQENKIDRAPYARITESRSREYDEKDQGLQIERLERYEYDGYGNVEKYYDEGDAADGGDGVRADIKYLHDAGRHIHDRPSEITVKDGAGRVLRRREGSYTEEGGLKELRQYYGGDRHLDMRYRYDGLGNLAEAADGAGVTVRYKYDGRARMYAEEIEETDGEVSYRSLRAWDAERGLKKEETGINGEWIKYEYDDWGLLKEVRTAYDTGAAAAVSYEYRLGTLAKSAY
jgi:YD repeat-containing protein